MVEDQEHPSNSQEGELVTDGRKNHSFGPHNHNLYGETSIWEQQNTECLDFTGLYTCTRIRTHTHVHTIPWAIIKAFTTMLSIVVPAARCQRSTIHICSQAMA